MKAILLYILSILLISNAVIAQSTGCTDSTASNYNPKAKKNDGSCVYKEARIEPLRSVVLPDILDETSGLLYFDHKIWTHTDDSEAALYAIDTHSLYLQDTLILSSLKNVDWEDIAQDTSFIYIGDFGNNAKGNRQNLTILRVHKSSIHQSLIIVDSINFSYSKQVDFQNQPANTSNFDCEAFIVMHDSLYLFTKEWSTYYTSIYVLPVKPGTYKAYYRGRFAVPGLITGASFYATTNTIVFCGYSKTLQPFLYLLYDFPTHDLFKGNKRQIALNLPFYQVEGICSSDGYNYYFSNEKFSQSMIRVPQQIHQLNLRPFLPSIKQEMNHE